MNQHDDYSALRQAFAAGARIQVWRLQDDAITSNDGEWHTIVGRPYLGCAPNLYRVHPEDAHLVQNDGRGAFIEKVVAGIHPYTVCHPNGVRLKEFTVKESDWLEFVAKTNDAAIHAQAGGAES
jgi:hypothetical protein